MTQLDFHKDNSFKPPPIGSVSLPILQHVLASYKMWHEFLPHVTKSAKRTLGEKIDQLFLEAIEFIFIAGHQPKTSKAAYLQKAVIKLDLLKLFLRIIWEIKGMDNKKYITLSESVYGVGRMLGAWYKQVTRENPAHDGAGSK